jgi:hypothetical protein
MVGKARRDVMTYYYHPPYHKVYSDPPYHKVYDPSSSSYAHTTEESVAGGRGTVAVVDTSNGPAMIYRFWDDMEPKSQLSRYAGDVWGIIEGLDNNLEPLAIDRLPYKWVSKHDKCNSLINRYESTLEEKKKHIAGCNQEVIAAIAEIESNPRYFQEHGVMITPEMIRKHESIQQKDNRQTRERIRGFTESVRTDTNMTIANLKAELAFLRATRPIATIADIEDEINAEIDTLRREARSVRFPIISGLTRELVGTDEWDPAINNAFTALTGWERTPVKEDHRLFKKILVDSDTILNRRRYRESVSFDDPSSQEWYEGDYE